MGNYNEEEIKNLIRESFVYDAIGGMLYRIKRATKHSKNREDVFNLVGTLDSYGYLVTTLKGKSYKVHRIAWLLHYGDFPIGQIDHINHNKTDNRIDNLRDVDSSDNTKNLPKSKNNKSGTTGVCWHKNDKRWTASISVDGKLKFLGNYTDYSDAVNARKNAEVLYGYHENCGKDS